jgi:phosphoglycolate phosphatase
MDTPATESSEEIALPHPPDAVLFDLDGTIIDSRVPFAYSMNHALAAFGRRQREPEELWRYLGPPTHQTFAELLSEDGRPADEQLVNRAVAFYREHYMKHGPETTTVYDGIEELLRDLHGRVPLAVATSKVIDATEDLLAKLGLTRCFDAICGPSMDAVNEPKSTTVAHALSALGGGEAVTAPVMIGDRFYDVAGAREQGVPTIGVLWGAGTESELREAGAAAIVSAPAEIPPLLGL